MGSAQVKPSKSSNFYDDSPKPIADRSDRGNEMEAIDSAPTQDEAGLAAETKEEVTDNDKKGEDPRSAGGGDADDDDDEKSEVGEKSDKKEEKLDLTPEELEAYQDDHLAKFNEKITAVQSKDSLKQEDGDYISEVTAVVMKMYRCYFQMNNVKKVPLALLIQWRHRVASVAMERKLLVLMCDIVIESYPDRWPKEDGKLNYLMKFTLLALLNFCDASSDFAIATANYPGLCEKMKEILEDRLEEHINKSETISKGKMTQWALSIIHNLSMPETNIGRLREVEILQILVSYLKSPKNMMRLNAFASVAGIINEKESEIIQANKKLVAFLLEVLSKGSSTRLHRHFGWSCKECMHCVRMLARNDANKKLLVELGALELLVKMGKKGNQDEQYEAVSALWTLSFDVDNRKKICNEEELGVVDLFEELKGSEEARIKKVCKGALWTIRDDLKASSVEKYRNFAQAASPEHTTVTGGLRADDAGHVMISYQWADQKTLIQIRDQMKAAGIKVWMDIDQMGGSTLESMARAVEQAKVVLMCMSQKYKNSPNCRAEAEYAFQKHKPIVPLKMERGYMPDGWLGFLCGAKLFFEFSGKYKFEDKMRGLLKEINTIYNKSSPAGGDGAKPVQAVTVQSTTLQHADQADSRPPAASGTHASMATPAVTQTLKTVRAWKPEDVQKWIEKNDLKSCNVSQVTGGEVAMLLMMYSRAPECFFKCVQETLKLRDLKNMSKIVLAISDLADMH